jgi:predicted transcriptional regulator
MFPTHTITCHYETDDGEHAIEVDVRREGLGHREWVIESDLSDVPSSERESVEQQAIDGYVALEERQHAHSDDDRGPGTVAYQDRAAASAPKRTRGATIPEPERRARGQRLLAVRISPELAAALDRESERRKATMPDLVRTALGEWLAGR